MSIDVTEYTYRVEWSEEDNAYVATVKEFELLSAHGDTMEEAYREIKTVVATTIYFLEESGADIPLPPSRIVSDGGSGFMVKMKRSFNDRRMFDRDVVYQSFAIAQRVSREYDYGNWKPLKQIDTVKDTLSFIMDFINSVASDRHALCEYIEEPIKTLEKHTQSSGQFAKRYYEEPLISLRNIIKKVVTCVEVLECEHNFGEGLARIEEICEWLEYPNEEQVSIHDILKSIKPVVRVFLTPLENR